MACVYKTPTSPGRGIVPATSVIAFIGGQWMCPGGVTLAAVPETRVAMLRAPMLFTGRPREDSPASNGKGHSMRSMILALVAVLAIAGATPAFAGGGSKGDWELGVFGGRGFLDDYGGAQPADAFIIGGRLGHFLSSKWSLELSGQWLSTDTDFEDPLIEDVEVNLSAYRLNLLHNFGAPGSGVRPFITVGGGSEKTEVEEFEQRDFGWNAGVGLRFFLSPSLNLRLDGRYVGINVGGDLDESVGNMEATAGLSLLFGGGGEEAVEAAVPVTSNQPPTVKCAADKAEVMPGETVNVTATAMDPEGDPITYMWTTSVGQVTGTGTAASVNFTGVTAPSSATVTVRATDSNGNSATSDCTVRLAAAQQPAAAAVSCLAGGFPADKARLNNVDKACLDDVASRLGSDPRARVVVVGSADASETAGMAQLRADAVRDYLVTERRIEAARITAQAGTGASATAGRQVTVWFVPEGATVPTQ
jgi:outer membrane protein OmpA-like peptidoglycan-associated protein/opacity protein-like surface antigen